MLNILLLMSVGITPTTHITHPIMSSRKVAYWFVDCKFKDDAHLQYEKKLGLYSVATDGTMRLEPNAGEVAQGPGLRRTSAGLLNFNQLNAAGDVRTVTFNPSIRKVTASSTDLSPGLIIGEAGKSVRILYTSEADGGHGESLAIFSWVKGNFKQVVDLKKLRLISKSHQPTGHFLSGYLDKEASHLAFCVKGTRAVSLNGEDREDLVYSLDLVTFKCRLIGCGFQAIWLGSDKLLISTRLSNVTGSYLERKKLNGFTPFTIVQPIAGGPPLAKRIGFIGVAASRDGNQVVLLQVMEPSGDTAYLQKYVTKSLHPVGPRTPVWNYFLSEDEEEVSDWVVFP